MVAKQLIVAFVLAVLVAQGQCLTEIWLPDETTTHISNPFIPKSISIAKSWLDTLVSCHLIFPNGAMQELYPTNTLVHEFILSGASGDAFGGCGAFFRNAPPSLSGTYELLSVVDHTADNSRSLTRQRYHLTFTQ